MRDVERIDRILNLLKEVWRENPDLRLIQLLINLFPKDKDLFYIEDKEIEKSLFIFLEKYKTLT